MTSVESDIAPLPTAVQRYFEVALYLLMVCGFGTLASTGGLDLPTILLVVTALLFRGYFLVKRRIWLIPEPGLPHLRLSMSLFISQTTSCSPVCLLAPRSTLSFSSWWSDCSRAGATATTIFSR